MSPGELSGYISTGYKINIDQYCCDGEADEIICYIDYVPVEKFTELFSHLRKKVSVNGKLVLHGTDLVEVCNIIMKQKVSQEQAILQIYGDSVSPKRMMLSLDKLVEVVENSGMKILKKRLDGLNICVECCR